MSQKRFSGAKIVIVGSAGVGKTAFAVRYLTKRYIGDYDRDKANSHGRPQKVFLHEELNTMVTGPLLNVTARRRKIQKQEITNKEMLYSHKLQTTRDEITLDILDTASQPSRDTLERHIKWGEGFIFIYSLTDKTSVRYLEDVKEILEKIKGTECPLVLVANKTDMLSARDIAEEDNREMEQKFDCPKFEISVADGIQGVLEVMEEILCQLKRDHIKKLNSENVSPTDGKPKSKLYSMKKAFKKRINRSHSDTF